MFKKPRHECEEQIQSEQAAWEMDKNILSLNESDDCTISIGYATHSMEDYQELLPLILNVMEELLKVCTVFTWLKTPPLPDKILRLSWLYQKTLHEAIPNLAAQYAAEGHPETFFDGNDELLVRSQGANGLLMERFYQISNCATAFQHAVYGFYTPPVINQQGAYEDVHFCVVHPLADYVITYRDFHVELNIRINPATVSRTAVLERLQQICKENGKQLIGCQSDY